MTPEVAEQVYDILVATCGAAEQNRDSFVRYLSDGEEYHGHEFRFQGDLGFGGKFYDSLGTWWVACYPEDETAERVKMIRLANVEIARLRESLGIV